MKKFDRFTAWFVDYAWWPATGLLMLTCVAMLVLHACGVI